jgi:hypothetical protein
MASMRRIAALSSTVLVVGCFKPSDDEPTDTEASTSAADDDDATMTEPTATNPTADDAPTDATMTADDDSTTATVTATDPTSDDATDPDGDTTTPTTLDTSATTDSTTEPPAECGNGMVEDGEICDDGVNAGADVGDCAPDCSTEVEIREIVVSDDTFPGDIEGSGPGSVIENLDDGCPFGYRAMFSDGADRIASETANTGDGQVDWVLRPWTAYVNEDGDLLAITDGAALLGVRDGVFSNLENAIGTPSCYTGLNQDWTSMQANENCNNWSNATDAYQMMVGLANSTNEQFLRQSQDFTYGCSDQGFTRPIYCVEE